MVEGNAVNLVDLRGASTRRLMNDAASPFSVVDAITHQRRRRGFDCTLSHRARARQRASHVAAR